jgi:glycosyltransferase involved in cell wall biosynthesis
LFTGWRAWQYDGLRELRIRLNGCVKGLCEDLKVLHVISSLAINFGGPVQVVRGLAKSQVRAGLDVTICTTNADYPAGKRAVPLEVPVVEHGFSTWYFDAEFASLLLSFGMGRWLRRSMHSFDLVHIHGLYRFPQTWAGWCARRTRTPYLIQPHGALSPPVYKKSRYGIWLKRTYEQVFDRANLNGASALHYTTRDEMEHASFLKLRAPGIVIPNGIELEGYTNLPPRGSFRARYGIDHDAPVVLFAGRLNAVKGLDLLVPAFARIARAIPKAVLVIAGPDNDNFGKIVRRWVSEERVSNNVYVTGALKGGGLKEAYVDADVFVLPSYTENFGMAVAEAMACALPVVISDQVNIHAEVAGASAGMVTRCDVDEVAGALVTLLRDPNRRRAMGEAGRRLVQARYTWPVIVEALTQEYQAVIERQHGATATPRRSGTAAGEAE